MQKICEFEEASDVGGDLLHLTSMDNFGANQHVNNNFLRFETGK